MKNFIISASVIALVLVVFFNFNYNQKYISVSDRHLESTTGFNGAQEYLMSLKMDPATGKIPINAVLKARENVAQMQMARSSNTNLVWKEMGPDNVGGRTRAILIDKDNSDKMFAGGVSGGLWMSTNAGFNWSIVPGTDELSFSGIVSMCQTSNGDIYIGTGEGETANNGGTSNGATGMIGGGIYKSIDGGMTFEHLDSTIPTSLISTTFTFSAVTEMAAHSTDPNTVYAATVGGLQLTTDGGVSWTSAINGASFLDIEVASNGYVYASTANRIYSSLTGEVGSFDLVDMSVFGSGTGRIELAIAPSDQSYIYAIYSNAGGLGQYKGIYRSTDSGMTWEELIPGWDGSTPPVYNIFNQQANYAMTIAVDPSNKDRIIIGGLDLWAYEYGADIEPISFWSGWEGSSYYVHADQHDILYHPTIAGKFYVANDGGVYSTNDNGNSFLALNRGYSVTQFYTVGFSSEGYVIGGTQDNGTQLIDFTDPISDMSADEVRGGDGGFALISHIDSDIMFAESQNGSAGRSGDGGNSFGGMDSFLGDEISGLAQSASDANADGLFATFINPMELWESVNEDGSPKDTSFFFAATSDANGNFCAYMTKGALDFSNVPSWYQVTPNGNAITRMAVSPDGNHLFFARGSRLYRTDNLNIDSISDTFDNLDVQGLTSVVATKELDIPGSNTITSISFDHNNQNRIVVTTGNYSNNDHIYKSNNAMSEDPTFISIQGDLPSMPVYSSVIDITNSNRTIIGTEFGMYSTTSGVNWILENNGLPLVPCHMMRQQTLPGVNKGTIYVATHGRGIFKSTNIVGLEEFAQNEPATSTLNLYPNPVQSFINIDLDVDKVDLIQIVDMMGKVVYSSENKVLKIDVSKFEIGTYIVLTKGVNGKKVGQFIKTK
jgi:photosystem II stability/assembly factor-like uncharacterized protein